MMEKMHVICIAGKNNIAVDVLYWLLKRKESLKIREVCVVCNSTDDGKNKFQKSLKYFARLWNVPEYSLEDMYYRRNLIFISLEYDRIIRPENFSDARLYNIHFSLLPRYKGMYTSALPILNGDRLTGVTLHRIDAGIDTGDIIAQQSFSINGMNCREVYLSYIYHGTNLILRNICSILSGMEMARPQSLEASTYYSRKSIDYGNLNVDYNQTAEGIARQIRAYDFREYQLPQYESNNIAGYVMTTHRSRIKAGKKIFNTNEAVYLSSVDYDIILYFDRLEELKEACRVGDIVMVAKYARIPRLINSQDTKHGWSPLMVAVYNNQKEIVKYLLTAGADIYAVNYNGTNLLMYAKAAYENSGDNELFRLFYSLGLDYKVMDYRGKTLEDYLNGIKMSELLKENCAFL